MTNDEKINLIGQKIVLLSNNLDKYKTELAQLQFELNVLKSEKNVTEKITPVPEEQVSVQPIEQIERRVKTEDTIVEVKKTEKQQNEKAKKALGFEETIGARWFSIIGIAVLVLGIAIGVKYAIDQNLINETTRLVLGYVAGGIILSLALLYKKKYDVFSAILLSGAMVVMFFTTYVGYSHYHFYSAPVAFCIMTLFTAFTVFAAHIYNYEVIALIGLVGGYAIPPLLSSGSGEIQYMFGFMLILNLGVLILSFKKYWKFVNHVAYALSWLIFAVWMASSYKPEIYFGRTMFFATAFYLIFYMSFITYKIFRNKPFNAWDVVLMLSNSLIYFGIGYNAMSDAYHEQFQGLFCVVNAVFHLGFALLCRKKELADKTIYYFIIAMIISFITIAIPVQLEGNFVTLIWLTEMVVLIWMNKKTDINTYKYLAYGITLLAFGSLWHDWSNYSYFSNNTDTTLAFKPLMNRYFLTSIIGTGVFGFVWFLNRQMLNTTLSRIANVCLIVFGLIVCYMTFANEIMLYFDIQYKLSEAKHYDDYGYDRLDYDRAWNSYSALWMVIYSMVFVSALSWVSIKKFSDTVFAYISWGLSFIVLVISLTAGLMIIADLKDEAVYDYAYSRITTWNYNSRYLFVPFLGLMIVMIYQFRNAEILKKIRPVNFWLFHIVILIVLSNELSHIITMMHLDDYNHYSKVAYRMGYTVLWGLYSMALITYGILRERKTLRFIAISLFVLTLLKLTGDAMSMTMGYRLIVFIVIGIILLVVSFMYQKFKPLLFGKDEGKKEIEPNTTETDETN